MGNIYFEMSNDLRSMTARVIRHDGEKTRRYKLFCLRHVRSQIMFDDVS
jgi:hypothetical protein